MKPLNRARRKVLPTAVGLASLSLILASCGGSGDTSGGGEGGVEPVTIGLIEPLSGPFADNGQQARLGAELCAKQINEAGGIQSLDGAKIEFAVQDTGAAAPGQVANQLQSLIDQNELSAIIGAWASSYTLAAAPVAESAQIPMVTESFADDIIDQGYEFIFKIPASATLMGSMAVDSVLELAEKSNYEIDTAAAIADNTSAAQVSMEGAVARLKDKGINVPVVESFAPGLTDANSLAIQVLSDDPDIIFVQGAVGDMALLQRAIRDRGYTGPLLGAGSGIVAVDYGTTVGEAANGTFSSAGWNWDLPGEAAKQFAEDFTAAHPKYEFPGQEAGEDCAAVYIIAEALEVSGAREPVEVRNALDEVKITEGPATMLVPEAVSFDEDGMLENTSPVIIQWQEGLPYTVYPEKIASRDAVFEF